jgi:hypothetical protein
MAVTNPGHSQSLGSEIQNMYVIFQILQMNIIKTENRKQKMAKKKKKKRKQNKHGKQKKQQKWKTKKKSKKWVTFHNIFDFPSPFPNTSGV